MADSANRIEPGREERHFSRMMRNPLYMDIIIYLILFISVVVTVIPILSVVVKSISPVWVNDKYRLLLWPIQLTDEAYRYILKTPTIMKAFFISVGRTGIGTTINLIVTVAAAYGSTKYEVPGVKAFMLLVVFSMMFSAGIIPLYILIRSFGLMNNYLVYIISAMLQPFLMILMRIFMLQMPKELEESARIDGASEFQILGRIVLPLMKASLATIGLFYAIFHWNDFWTPLLFVSDQRKWTLALLLRSIIYENDMTGMGTIDQMLLRERVINPENIQAATIVFATVPIVLVYPFLQRHFTKGILIGAVKG